MIVSIGYLASLFLAVSLLMTNTLKFRWFNTLGNVAFVIYGVLINAFPIIVANSVLLCINIYQLSKLYKYKEQFLFATVSPSDEIVKQFVNFYKKDIAVFFPNFNLHDNGNKISFMVLRNLNIACLFIAEKTNHQEAVVDIDYTIANFRDYKVGKFIFETEKQFLLANKVKKIVYKKVDNKKHLDFIKAMGFKEELVDNYTQYYKLL
jgi:hypothetical protein